MAEPFREARDTLDRMVRVLNPGSAVDDEKVRNAGLARFSKELRKSRDEINQKLQDVLQLVSAEQSLLSQLNHDVNAMRGSLRWLEQAANWDKQSDPLGVLQVAETQFVTNLKALKETLARVKEKSEGINGLSKTLGL